MGFFILSGAPSVPATPASVAPHAAAPAYPVTLTAYNALPDQTDADPETTASGAYANPSVVAARSRDLAKALPFGTIIEIDGPATEEKTCGYGRVASRIGYRIIADVMNARYANRIDILFDTQANYVWPDGSVKNAATVMGVCPGARVRVVGKIDLTSGKLPATQRELASIVSGDALTLAR